MGYNLLSKLLLRYFFTLLIRQMHNKIRHFFGSNYQAYQAKKIEQKTWEQAMKVAQQLRHEYPNWASLEYVARELIDNSKAA